MEAGEKNAKREALVQVILEKRGDFWGQQTMLLVLGDTDITKLQITETELMTQLRQVHNVPDSIEQAARILTRDCWTAGGIFVYPFAHATPRKSLLSQQH